MVCVYTCVCVNIYMYIYCPAPLPAPAPLTQPLEPVLILKSLTYFASTCQRLHTLETCWGYGEVQHEICHLSLGNRSFLRHRPLSSGKPIPGCPALGKERELREPPPTPPTPSAPGGPSRPLRIGDLNPADSLLIGRGQWRQSPIPSERRLPVSQD